jgi:hypothetical protein
MNPLPGTPAHSEGLVWSPVDMTWLPRDEFERRRAARERRHTRRRQSNEFPCPQRHIRDVDPFAYGLREAGTYAEIGNRQQLRDYLARNDLVVSEPDDRRLDRWRADVEHEEAVAREVQAAMQTDPLDVAPPVKEDGTLVDTSLADIVS